MEENNLDFDVLEIIALLRKKQFDCPVSIIVMMIFTFVMDFP